MPQFKNCDFCETAISADSPLCPNCGHPQRTGAEWYGYYRSVVLTLVLGIAIFVAWMALVGPR